LVSRTRRPQYLAIPRALVARLTVTFSSVSLRQRAILVRAAAL
jgi:hypothetical protein